MSEVDRARDMLAMADKDMNALDGPEDEQQGNLFEGVEEDETGK